MGGGGGGGGGYALTGTNWGTTGVPLAGFGTMVITDP